MFNQIKHMFMDVDTPAKLALEFNARFNLAKKDKTDTGGKTAYRFVLIGLFNENRVHFDCNSGNFKKDLSVFQKILNYSRKKNKKAKQNIAKPKSSELSEKQRTEVKILRPVLRAEKKKVVQAEPLLFLDPEEIKNVLKETKENSSIDQEGEMPPQWGTSTKFSSLEEEVKVLELNPEIYF